MRSSIQVYADADDKQMGEAARALDMAPEQTAEDEEVQQLAQALANLPQEHREALAEALSVK